MSIIVKYKMQTNITYTSKSLYEDCTLRNGLGPQMIELHVIVCKKKTIVNCTLCAQITQCVCMYGTVYSK